MIEQNKSKNNKPPTPDISSLNDEQIKELKVNKMLEILNKHFKVSLEVSYNHTSIK